jgi:hypothetical protein
VYQPGLLATRSQMKRALVEDVGVRAVDQALSFQQGIVRLAVFIGLVGDEPDQVVVGVGPLQAERTRTV